MSKPSCFLLTLCLQIDEGVHFGGFEFHEKYITMMPAETDDIQILEAIKNQFTTFGACKVFKAGIRGGFMLNGNCRMKVCRQLMPKDAARTILDHKVLPFLNIVVQQKGDKNEL